jgi:hypothetical protein
MRDFSPFEQAFERGELAVPAYLTLLGLASPGVDVTIDRIEEALEHPEHPAGLRRLLADANWRPHLVAATAMLAMEDPRPFIDALWAAIRHGSWVSPQLAVVASLVDPAFVSTAKARLDAGCPVELHPELASASPAARHSISGSTGTVGRSEKEANALVELLGLDRDALDPALRKLVSDDLDDGASIAVGWLARIKDHFAARGRRLGLA